MADMHSEAVWRSRYERWKASGLDLKEFGAREKVRASSLSWWTRRMRELERRYERTRFVRVVEDAGEVLSDDGARAETEAKAESRAPAATTAVEVALPNGLRLHVPCGVSALRVRELVATLSEISL